jgi:hypothetical protein
LVDVLDGRYKSRLDRFAWRCDADFGVERQANRDSLPLGSGGYKIFTVLCDLLKLLKHHGPHRSFNRGTRSLCWLLARFDGWRWSNIRSTHSGLCIGSTYKRSGWNLALDSR